MAERNWWERPIDIVGDVIEDAVRRVAGLPTGDDRRDPNTRVPVPGAAFMVRPPSRQDTGEADIVRRTDPMTQDQRNEVQAFWAEMQNNRGLWWNVELGEPNESGQYDPFYTQLRTGNWNLEQTGEDKGWTDAMIGHISTLYNSGPERRPDLDPDGGLWGDDSGGSGGSGGSSGPTYVSPMREVIEDTVKSMMTALTGDENESLVQQYSDMYGAAHRDQYDVRMAGGEDVDPNQVVLEAIRSSEPYQRIHQMRPDSQSETKWISDRVGRLTQLGMQAGDADERAVWLAQTGTNLNDIDTGAAQNAKGIKDITLFNKIGKAASQVVGQL